MWIKLSSLCWSYSAVVRTWGLKRGKLNNEDKREEELSELLEEFDVIT